MKKLLSLLILLFSAVSVFANGADIEMADKMRSEGKIYVVIGTIVIIFVGLAIYLFSMDKRLKKIEKNL